jgi:hypothetical protein
MNRLTLSAQNSILTCKGGKAAMFCRPIYYEMAYYKVSEQAPDRREPGPGMCVSIADSGSNQEGSQGNNILQSVRRSVLVEL